MFIYIPFKGGNLYNLLQKGFRQRLASQHRKGEARRAFDKWKFRKQMQKSLLPENLYLFCFVFLFSEFKGLLLQLGAGSHVSPLSYAHTLIKSFWSS